MLSKAGRGSQEFTIIGVPLLVTGTLMGRQFDTEASGRLLSSLEEDQLG